MSDPQPAFTAIDIALEPDSVMMDRALADNAALRANVPQGFALDATHHAHVTLLQCFVRTAGLPTIYAVTEEILAQERYADWKFVPAGPIGLAGIAVEATAAAFYTTPAEADIHPSVIPYVGLRFGPWQSMEIVCVETIYRNRNAVQTNPRRPLGAH